MLRGSRSGWMVEEVGLARALSFLGSGIVVS